MKRTLTILTVLLLTLILCNNILPAGFWTDYNKDLIKEKISDQGPWGGQRIVYWKANKNDDFNSKSIVAFAEKNDWVLLGSTEYSKTDLDKWVDLGKPIFPLIITGFKPVAKDRSSYKNFPRWITNELTVYKLKFRKIIFKKSVFLLFPDTPISK